MLPFKHLTHLDHYTPDHELFAVVFTHEETKLMVELRYNPEQASAQKGWDPITWGVQGPADLESWAQWLDTKGVKRSRVFTGVQGWLLACEDPDGRHIRLYTVEEHEWTVHPDKDDYWLGGAIKGQKV